MSDTLYYIISAVLSLGVLYGIKLMSKVKTAALGNRISALCMLIAIVVTFIKIEGLAGSLVYIILGLLAGTLISVVMASKVKMIQMPQMVGLLNGLGGFASALTAVLTVLFTKDLGKFELVTSGLALAVGALTFSGSMVAAGKLHGKLPQKPKVYPAHGFLTGLTAILMLVLIVLMALNLPVNMLVLCLVLSALGLAFGWFFAIRVGGADMPITISLLNSTSGVAAAIAGMALGDILLVAVGGIVGASGLLLTQIMCRSMNRSLVSVVFGGKAKPHQAAAVPVVQEEIPAEPLEKTVDTPVQEVEEAPATPQVASLDDLKSWIQDAKSVIIIPGYGMAMAQAQEKVKQLLEKFKAAGKNVRFAIHPVAGRMPGHMNVLLAEVDIDYELLCEMGDINGDFPTTDLSIVIGANDVINPAANTAEGTPIYGMPILDASLSKHLVICNFDKKPGYAGVENPLYEDHPNILLLLGDAKDSLDTLLSSF